MAVLILAAVVRYYHIFSVNYANGWDGAYYQMQAQCFWEDGVQHSKDYSLIYLPLLLLSAFGNYLFAYKLTAVLCSAFFTVALYLLVSELKDYKTALVVSLLSLSSPHLLFYSHQFSKNLLGLAVFLLFVLALKKKEVRLQLITLILALFAHRVSFVLCIFFFAFTGFFQLKRKYQLLVISSTLGLALVGIPGLITFYDSERLLQEFNFNWYWAPTVFYHKIRMDRLPLVWLIEHVLLHCIWVYQFYVLWKKEHFKELKYLFFAILLLMLPAYYFEIGSMGYRLYLIATVLTFPLIGVVSLGKNFVWYGVVIVVLLPFSSSSYQPLKFDPPVVRYERIVAVVKKEIGQEKNEVFIIAHKGIKEQLIMKTEYEALNWLPDRYEKHTHYYRILTNISEVHLIKYLTGEELQILKRLPYGYWLIPEKIWIKFKERIMEEEQLLERINTWQNPYQKRPSFLRK